MLRPTRALAAALLAAALAAQEPSPWADLSLPGGVAPAAISSLGKLVVYRDTADLDVYSAFTRAWHRLPIGQAATVRQANDWLLVQDGSTWTALSSMTGRFVPLTVSGAAVVVNPASQRNDSILLVRDGTSLHAFSGFTGTWVTRPLGAGATALVQRHVALLEDTNLLAGMSAFTGRWIDQTLATTPTAGSVDGTAAVAEANGLLFGFSALRETWTSHPALPAAPQFQRDSDFALWRDASSAVAFSGPRGAFSTHPVPGAATFDSDELLAVLTDGTVAHLYSAATGSWRIAAFSGAGFFSLGQAVALLSDGRQHTAFSAVRGTLTPIVLDSTASDAVGVVAYLLDRGTGRPVLFSALTGLWTPAPADVLPQQPALAHQLALMDTTAGFRAWSARTGAFVPLTVTGGVPDLNRNSSLCLVWDATAIHVFEPRRDVWLSVNRASPAPPTTRVWRTTLIAVDGNDSSGLGAMGGQLWATALPEPFTGLQANSECGYVTTAHHVVAFGGAPELSGMPQFPEFRRAFVGGATLRWWLRLPQGHVAFLAGGMRGSVAMPIAGLGELVLDPSTMVVALRTPDPGQDRAAVDLQVPDLPILRGSEWFFQALVLPPSGAPWLGEAASVLVL